MSEIKFPDTDLTIIDPEGKFEMDKDVKGSFRYDSTKKGVIATTAVTKKRDNSPNTPIFDSKSISLTVRIHSDGRLGPSGKISKKMVKELGDAVIRDEFIKAANAIITHFK